VRINYYYIAYLFVFEVIIIVKTYIVFVMNTITDLYIL